VPVSASGGLGPATVAVMSDPIKDPSHPDYMARYFRKGYTVDDAVTCWASAKNNARLVLEAYDTEEVGEP